ncbi:MAG: hypothetical protein MN733_04345 [Nitrososphaera sp.]|nr:hypothetical protein [Nitrososphaera sp.]
MRHSLRFQSYSVVALHANTAVELDLTRVKFGPSVNYQFVSWDFALDADIPVTRLGVFDRNGLGQAHPVGLRTSAGVLPGASTVQAVQNCFCLNVMKIVAASPTIARDQASEQDDAPGKLTSDITFVCPSCQQHIACDESYRGEVIECPTCHADMIVPAQLSLPPLPEIDKPVPTLCSTEFIFPQVKSAVIAVSPEATRTTLPWAYGLILGSYCVLIAGYVVASGFGRNALEGLRFWIPTGTYIVIFATGLAISCKSKGYSASLGVSLILLGPFGVLPVLLFTDRSKVPKSKKPTTLICSVCGASNPIGAVFCENCSRNLHMRHADSLIAPEPSALPETASISIDRPPAVVIACVLLGLGLLLVVPAMSVVGNVFQEKLGIFTMPSILVGIVVTAFCILGLWRLRRWAVVTYTCFAVLNQVGLLMLGVWSGFSAVVPAVIVALMFMNFEKMR